MASLFDAFVPQVSQPSAYQATGGYQPPPSYMVTRSAPASGQPMATPTGNLQAPAGTQDQYDAYQAGRSAPALTNSATGKPLDMSGQVDESKVDTRNLGQRLGLGGRLSNALDTASLMASMIKPGATIGENISNVGAAIHNLPYAELMHQYQMGEPGLERTKQLLGLQATQAETALKQSQAGYYSTRNQASILAQQLRGQAAENMRAQAGKPIPRWGTADQAGTSPHGEPFQAGQKVWGYDVPQYVPGNPNDPTDPGTLKHTFQPMSTEDEEMKARWGLGGGHSFQQQYISNYMAQFPKGVKGDIDPASPGGQQALMDEATRQFEQTTKVDPAIAAMTGGAGVPTRPSNPQVDRSAADKDEYKALQLPEKTPKASEVASMSPQERAMYGLNPDPFHPDFMQDPGKVSSFAKDHNQKLAQFRDQYAQLPRDQQTGFQRYLVDQGYNPQTHQFAAQQNTAPGGHDIQYGTWKYHYKGQGDQSDIRNYTPFTQQEMEPAK